MQPQKTDMGKRQFRIGDLARELHIKKFVIRFWEREFDLKSDRSQGGQRFYTDEDLKTFSTIKNLLYEQGFTIAGAKKHLQPALDGETLTPPTTLAAMTMEAAPSTTCAQEEAAKDTYEDVAPSTDFVPCTHDLQSVASASIEADTSDIVPATTMYEERTPLNEQQIVEDKAHFQDDALIQARVRQEVLQTIAPIKEKLLRLKQLLD